MLVNSVTTSPAPICLHCNRSAGSLTPAMGAKNALLENVGSIKQLENLDIFTISKNYTQKQSINSPDIHLRLGIHYNLRDQEDISLRH